MSRQVLILLALGSTFAGACNGGGSSTPQAPRSAEERTQGGASASGVVAAPDALDRRFLTEVHPFLERYCFKCHGPAKHKADLNLSLDADVAAIARNSRQWDLVRSRLQSQEMPPEEESRQPAPKERASVASWLCDVIRREADRNAGDPGIVLARRLSNAEFDYTIRDLTGVDIRPTREFPVDPANEAGFDNTGESLTMSEALLRKYLAAARLVADHLVLKPHGFVFAPYPAVADTDRDKYCVGRIVDFYNRHRVDLADYFLAAWRFRHRPSLGRPQAGLKDVALEAGLSPGYLARVWSLLDEEPGAGGPVAELRAQWRREVAELVDPGEARRACDRLGQTVLRLRRAYPSKVDKLQVSGISNGSQTLLLRRNDQLAAQHLEPAGVPDPAAALFCRVFPDTFVVLERGPYYDANVSPKGRYLSAGFHLMQGYYRDDAPLCELVLDDASRREIDALWEELHFVTLDPVRQYKDFIFFERAEPPRFMFDSTFDFARSEDKDVTSSAKIQQLRAFYLAKACTKGAIPAAVAAIESYFARMNDQIRAVEAARRAAEASHLAALVDFASRAYRRPLSPTEREELLGFYQGLRAQDQLSHEEAMRDALASILLSPHFSYRFDLLAPASSGRVELTPYELASRLSYFLWSSMPDAELLAHAAAGDLHQPEVLSAQARRMLLDPKIRGLATEFLSNWLDFRRFEEHNAVDRQRFPSFTGELREAMFEEPIRYFVDIAQRSRPVLDLLYGHDTFVNRVLAEHYGMPDPPVEADGWVHVDDARRYGRGGLLTMSVFLTKNAPGLRTSPVKRGYWVVKRLLGEQIPPPPPTVPQLPKDEANMGELTLPQALARHREDKACAGCHRRFDSIGLVFEGFGPIGEHRTRDLGGKPVQDSGLFPDGKERAGLEGLAEYLRERRQDEFLENLCQKLLSYALGRSLQPSDRKTIEEMRSKLAAEQFAFGSLVDVIVKSPQFVNKRGRPEPH